ncbi:hypothetical protein FHS43_006958, partial [Streptosporangium becharense]|uniref:hypothetical protein n=1 Tax=Streptosporangium becharense TaxID=1816182 RepID=UPI001608CB4D
MITGVTARAAAKRARTADPAVREDIATIAVLRGAVPETGPATVSAERGVRAGHTVPGTGVTVRGSTAIVAPAVPRPTVMIVRVVVSGMAIVIRLVAAPMVRVTGATVRRSTGTTVRAVVTGVTVRRTTGTTVRVVVTGVTVRRTTGTTVRVVVTGVTVRRTTATTVRVVVTGVTVRGSIAIVARAVPRPIVMIVRVVVS